MQIDYFASLTRRILHDLKITNKRKMERLFDELFANSQRYIHLSEEECISIARDLCHIPANSIVNYSSIRSRERFSEYQIWRGLAQLKSIRPETNQAIRRVIDVMLSDELLETNGELSRGLLVLMSFPERSLLFWLMMPRVISGGPSKDPYSSSEQLFKNLQKLVARLGRYYSFWRGFREVFDRFILGETPLSKSRFWITLQRSVWKLLMESREMESMRDAYYGTRIRADLSLADVNDDYQRLLFDIHKFIITKMSAADLRLKSAICINMIYYKCATSWNEHKLFLAERMKLLEVITIRELTYWERTEFDDEQLHERQEGWGKSTEICRFMTLAEQTFLGSLDGFCANIDGFPRDQLRPSFPQGIQSAKWLVLGICRGLIENWRNPLAHQLSLIVRLLKHLECAYECKWTQEYPPGEYRLLPTCLELAFATPSKNLEMHLCEFAFFQDTLGYLERRIVNPDVDEEALRADLQYYRNEYNKFELCCSTLNTNTEPKFRCVGHNYCPERLGEMICPLLKRQFHCDHEGRTRPNCSSLFEFPYHQYDEHHD